MLPGTWLQERKGPVQGLKSRSGRRAQVGGAMGTGWGPAGHRAVHSEVLGVELIPGFSAGWWLDLSCVWEHFLCVGYRGEVGRGSLASRGWWWPGQHPGLRR